MNDLFSRRLSFINKKAKNSQNTVRFIFFSHAQVYVETMA